MNPCQENMWYFGTWFLSDLNIRPARPAVAKDGIEKSAQGSKTLRSYAHPLTKIPGYAAAF